MRVRSSGLHLSRGEVSRGEISSHRRVSHESQDAETFQHLWRKTFVSHNLYHNRICDTLVVTKPDVTQKMEASF